MSVRVSVCGSAGVRAGAACAGPAGRCLLGGRGPLCGRDGSPACVVAPVRLTGLFFFGLQKTHVTYIAGKLEKIFLQKIPVTGVTV